MLINLRSPSAAKAKQARMSSLVNSREIVKDLILAHSGSEVVQNIVNRDSHATNTRFSAALSRLNRNVFRVVHSRKITSIAGWSSSRALSGKVLDRVFGVGQMHPWGAGKLKPPGFAT